MSSHLRKREVYHEFLGKVKILQNLDTWERLAIADALEDVQFQPGKLILRFLFPRTLHEKLYYKTFLGDEVVCQGKYGTDFYMIISGQAEVSQRANENAESVSVGQLGPR